MRARSNTACVKLMFCGHSTTDTHFHAPPRMPHRSPMPQFFVAVQPRGHASTQRYALPLPYQCGLCVGLTSVTAATAPRP